MMSEQQSIERAIKEAQTGSSLIALTSLEEMVKETRNPRVLAWLGYCVAKERQDFSRAMVLCTSAIETTPDNPDLYLALGRVYLLAGRRYQALTTLRKGLKMGRHELIVKQLTAMGLRQDPVFGFLDRDHRVNILAGRLLARFKST
jgi:predicted Zn-dependent protease